MDALAPAPLSELTAREALEGRLRHAWGLAYASENEAAAQIAGEVLTDAQARGFEQQECRAEALLTVLALRHLDAESAARHAATAKSIAQRLGDPVLLAEARAVAARVCYTVGENDEGLAEIEAAWPVAERGADAMLRFDCENTLGIITGNLGQCERSIEWYRRAQETATAGGMPAVAAIASANAAGRLLEVGEAAQADGRLDDARRAWADTVAACDASLVESRAAGSRMALALNLTNRASALAYLGDFDRAMAACAEAQAAAQAIGDAAMAMYMIQPRVTLLRDRGQLSEALDEARRGVAYGERLRILHALTPLYELLSSLEEDSGNLRGALDAYRRFHALHEARAAERARQRAQVLAVRLATERALAEAQAAREHARRLAHENEALSAEARSFEEQARRDVLTGLANRRELDAVLAAADAGDPTQPWCVALLDVDHFKQVNDRHSHAMGDRVLAQVADLLRERVRSRDLAARYGGEEFAMIMPGANLPQAQQACEHVRAAIENHPWDTLAPGLSVTASIGVAERRAGMGTQATLALADERLYQAKRAGRNRVVATPAE